MKNSKYFIFGCLLGLLVIIGIAAERDETGTIRYRLGATQSFDTQCTVKDEDGNWTFDPNSVFSKFNGGVLNVSQSTNKINFQAANYNVSSSDSIVGLAANKTATLPTAVGIGGMKYTILCTGNGTNAILTTSSQTINGFSKYTNTAQFKFTTVTSDNTNWWVTGQN